MPAIDKNPILRKERSDPYHGFSLRNVTWGYRDIFARTIEELFKDEQLGPRRPDVTAKFFDMMKRADQSCFDHVLRWFLGALNPQNRWIMNIPAVFTDVVDLGAALAESKLYYGVRFFEKLAAGEMGSSPRLVQNCLEWIKRLRAVDDELAMAFLAGYDKLSRRLTPSELGYYVDVALKIHQSNPANGYAFLRGELNTSEVYLRSITRECRLEDISGRIRKLMQALTGKEYEVTDLSGLDSDDLIERGSRIMTVNGHLYLPIRFRAFDSAQANRNWYLLCSITSAAMMLHNSFALIHGHSHYSNCIALTGTDVWRVNLFCVMEYYRVLNAVKQKWPGFTPLLHFAIQHETRRLSSSETSEQLLFDLLDEKQTGELLQLLREKARNCINCFDTVRQIDQINAERISSDYKTFQQTIIKPLGFLTDFVFPMSYSFPPHSRLIANLQQQVNELQDSDQPPVEQQKISMKDEGVDRIDEEEKTAASGNAAFVYDEWDFTQGDYRPAWCHVRQEHKHGGTGFVTNEWLDEASKVRTVFERLKPDLARREKNLADGDEINSDLLLNHLIAQRLEPAPPARFYEKPRVNQRDLAVLILLDISGSTGEQHKEEPKVLDIEKQAAVIFGYGLSALDDRFAVCGFCSSGREHCEYDIYKGFDESWADDSIGGIMSAYPRNSTRMGPALRHSGYMLSLQPSRQKLIILVTDGKPMDDGYDPHSRYAQYDVRRACEENARLDINTFAISTEENSLADMELMFPRKRYMLLPEIQRLPQILPRLYLGMTR